MPNLIKVMSDILVSIFCTSIIKWPVNGLVVKDLGHRDIFR